MELKNLFYISSSGSMATQWLSSVLSTSEAIKCFHGVGALQETYKPKTKPQEAFSLVNTWALENDRDYAGIVHLSVCHGTLLSKFCEIIRIPFCALVRNPVLCVDSQFQARVDSLKHQSERKLIYIQQLESLRAVSCMPAGLTWEELVFSNCFFTVVSHLHQIESTSYPAFRFEKYTVDYEEIRRLVEVITRGAVTNDQQISDAFDKVAQVNAHRKIILSCQETWSQSWTDRQRQIFSGIWRRVKELNDRINVFYPDVDDLM